MIEDLIQVIKNNPSVLTELGITSSRDDYRGLTCYKYSDASPKANPLVKLCRGLVLDDDQMVVCRSLDRFYNDGEGFTNIDLSNGGMAYNKLDGTCINMYYHNDTWMFGTNKVPTMMNTNVLFNDNKKPLISVLEEYFCGNQTEYDYVSENIVSNEYWNTVIENINNQLDHYELDTDCTYVFELVSEYNKVIIDYSKIDLILIAIRNKNTGEYRELDNQFTLPESKEVNNVSDIMSFIKELQTKNGLTEGVVVTDSNGVRFKYKTKSYLSCTYGERIKRKDLIDIVCSYEETEFLAYNPVFTNDINELVLERDAIINEFDTVYDIVVKQLNDGLERKDLKNVVDKKYLTFVFQRLNNAYTQSYMLRKILK